MTVHWDAYKNFSEWEFRCKHTKKNKMRPQFMDMQQQIRSIYGKSMIVLSGYRDFTHPIEWAKEEPGEHYYGAAADYNVWGEDAMQLFDIAYHCGIRRIGLNQVGALSSRFIHIGMGDKLDLGFPSAFWTY